MADKISRRSFLKGTGKTILTAGALSSGIGLSTSTTPKTVAISQKGIRWTNLNVLTPKAKAYRSYLRGIRALGVIEHLMATSDSDTVKLNAAKEMLDRGGHKVFNEMDTGRTIEELNAQLVALVGKDGAKMLVGAFKSRKIISGPQLTDG